MKKIISLLICIMAFAGGLTLVQAKEKTDVNEAIEVLNTFDIVRKKMTRMLIQKKFPVQILQYMPETLLILTSMR